MRDDTRILGKRLTGVGCHIEEPNERLVELWLKDTRIAVMSQARATRRTLRYLAREFILRLNLWR